MNSKQFFDVLSEMREHLHVPSFSAAVMADGEQYAFQDGFADIAGKKAPDAETMYAIGSCTKSFVVGAVCSLVDRGIWQFDDPVKKYIPQLEMSDPWVADHLTIRDMMCHRTGLPRHELAWFSRSGSLKRDDLIRMIKYLEPNADFRTTYQYNNIMYALLGEMIGIVTGSSWQDVVRKNIWEPLGITRAAFSAEEAVAMGNTALPYLYDSAKNTHIRIDYGKMDAMSAAGAIYMSASDLLKYDTMLMNGGVFEGKRILSESCVNEMTNLQISDKEPGLMDGILGSVNHTKGYAFGLRTAVYRGRRFVGHGGHINGFMAERCFLPDEKIAFVMLTNLGVIHAALAMSYAGLDMLLGYGREMSEKLLEAMKPEYAIAISESVIEKALASPRKDDWTPCPVSPEAVCGRYTNGGYGDMEISLEGSRLVVSIGTLKIYMAHESGTEFYGEAPLIAAGILFHDGIEIDADGNVVAVCLEANLEPGSKRVRFERIK